jgi:hypothetical protein
MASFEKVTLDEANAFELRRVVALSRSYWWIAESILGRNVQTLALVRISSQ